MTTPAPLLRLMQGMRADLIGYGQLKMLLENQFEAALHHRGEKLEEIAQAILALADSLEERRRERVALAAEILGPGEDISIAAVFRQFPENRRQALESGWQVLEGLARECKALNERNGRLLMDQHEIMKYVLDGEADTYAPA
ncbi:MAG: flgN [Rhodocyclaceae bacterium]|nr:flgN [Rhodocyclaceae bacterium]